MYTRMAQWKVAMHGQAKVDPRSTFGTALLVLAIEIMKSVREPVGIWKFLIVLSMVDACSTGNVINYRYR